MCYVLSEVLIFWMLAVEVGDQPIPLWAKFASKREKKKHFIKKTLGCVRTSFAHVTLPKNKLFKFKHPNFYTKRGRTKRRNDPHTVSIIETWSGVYISDLAKLALFAHTHPAPHLKEGES
jgi:hypothetical protein